MESELIKRIVMLDLENKVIHISNVTAKEVNYLCERGYIVKIVNPLVCGTPIKFPNDFKYPVGG